LYKGQLNLVVLGIYWIHVVIPGCKDSCLTAYSVLDKGIIYLDTCTVAVNVSKHNWSIWRWWFPSS